MPNSHPNQLEIPDGPSQDNEAFELVRIWSSGDHQYFVINVQAFADEPAVWGIFALDLMKHAARAYQDLDGRSKEEAYKRALAGFMSEAGPDRATLTAGLRSFMCADTDEVAAAVSVEAPR